MDVKKEPDDELFSPENTFHGDYHQKCTNDDLLTDYSNNAPVKQEHFVHVKEHDEKEISATQNFASSENILFDSSDIKIPILYHEIKIEDVCVKKETLQPIVVVINVEKTVFYDTNFVCGVCMHIYASFSLLQVHKGVHKRSEFDIDSSRYQKLFKCGLCDFESKHKCYLKTHRMIHSGERPFKCDRCEYKCARSSTLKTHVQSHTGEKPFKCEKCNYKSARRSSLKVHQISHAIETPFECDQCDYKSGRMRSLKLHKLSHSFQRPFKCDQCSYKSAYLAGLKSHILSHSSERPFECDQCDYKSTRNNQLTRHKMKHTGQMPYQCDLCDKRFDQKFNFKRHKKIYHTVKSLILNEVINVEVSGAI